MGYCLSPLRGWKAKQIMFSIGITDHLEGPRDRPSGEVYAEVAELVRVADEAGVEFAWFAEHHAHLHQGHLPTPLLYALHLAGQTRRIKLGTAVICLNLHAALDVAEQVAVADALMGGRTCVGFGSGSTPEEFKLFRKVETPEAERHAAYDAALREIQQAWGRGLPVARDGLMSRCWSAVNSAGAARVAGRVGLNVLFSHLRTPGQYREYSAAYRAAGGRGRIAVNRPVYLGASDAAAWDVAGPAVRSLWRRFRAEGKIVADTPEPADVREMCGHPINFIVGGPGEVARQFHELYEACPYDVMNVEVRWAGISHVDVLQSVRRLMQDVMPRVG